MSKQNITIKNLNDHQLNKILTICNKKKFSYSVEILDENTINYKNNETIGIFNNVYRFFIPFVPDKFDECLENILLTKKYVMKFVSKNIDMKHTKKVILYMDYINYILNHK